MRLSTISHFQTLCKVYTHPCKVASMPTQTHEREGNQMDIDVAEGGFVCVCVY